MSTMPTSMPGHPGQTGLPGNTGNTVPANYSFLPSAPKQRTTSSGAGTTNSTIPTYTANNFSNASANNPFSSYTGFNLGLNSADEMTKMYGPLGTAMYYYLNNGAGYNPAVLNNLVNQIQPQVQEGLATLGSTASMTGNRFGSAYQIGSADYLSQVNQNELSMASNLYQQSQNTINSDMMGLLPGAGQYQSNKAGTTEALLASILPALTGYGNSSGGVLGQLLTSLGLGQSSTGATGSTPTTFPSGSTVGSSGGTLSDSTASIQDMINILNGTAIGGVGGEAAGGMGGSGQPNGGWSGTGGGWSVPYGDGSGTVQNPGGYGTTNTGGSINAQTGQATNSTDMMGQTNLNYLLSLLTQYNPQFGGTEVPTGGGGSDNMPVLDIPAVG